MSGGLGEFVFEGLFLLTSGIIACLLLALLGCAARWVLVTWRELRDAWRAGR